MDRHVDPAERVVALGPPKRVGREVTGEGTQAPGRERAVGRLADVVEGVAREDVGAQALERRLVVAGPEHEPDLAQIGGFSEEDAEHCLAEKARRPGQQEGPAREPPGDRLLVAPRHRFAHPLERSTARALY